MKQDKFNEAQIISIFGQLNQLKIYVENIAYHKQHFITGRVNMVVWVRKSLNE